MILRTDLIQDCCSTILQAISSVDSVNMPENLELKAEDKKLSIMVATNSYNVVVTKPIMNSDSFLATIKAQIFLKLITQVTSETITLDKTDSYIEIIANGRYKIPIIMENDSMLILPRIKPTETICSFDINSNYLNSIYKYNSTELSKGFISSPVSKLYYMDNHGCITFTPNSACINNFELDKETRVFLPSKVVNLFKLFKDNNIRYTFGKSDSFIVKFSGNNVDIISIVENPNSLISNIPVSNIRNMTNMEFDYSVVMDKVRLSQALDRLIIFNSKSIQQLIRFTFDLSGINIYDINNKGHEKLPYINSNSIDCSIVLDYKDLRLVLDCYPDSHITFNFNEDSPVVVIKDNVYMVMSQAEEL